MTTSPLSDIVAEGARVAALAADAGLDLRVAGGVGIALRCASARQEPLRRSYADIDLVGRGKDRKEIIQLLLGALYEADEQFNALHGARRLFFWDRANGRQLDVFLDRIEMCHVIDLGDRLSLPGETLPPADLLLMKLQVVETNAKDLIDILTLLVDQPFTEDDAGINLPYLTKLTGADWGIWKTSTMVIERADAHARALEGFDQRNDLHDQVRTLLGALEGSPKTRGWKLRAKVGERKRWYELPEESH